MSTESTKITWLGHSTFLIRTPEGKTILVDPWLSREPEVSGFVPQRRQ